MNKKMIAIISAVAVVGIGAGVMYSVFFNSSLTAEEMRLEKVSGNVQLQNNGEVKEIVEGSRLISKDNLATQILSDAHVLLDSTNSIRVEELSEIEINQNDKNYIIELNSGSLFFNVTENLGEDEILEFHTNNIVTGVRGTAGIVTYDNDSQTTQIAVLTGNIVGSSDSEDDEVSEKIIESGEFGLVTTNDDGSVQFEILSIQEDNPPFLLSDSFIDKIQNDLNFEGNSFNLSEELRKSKEYVIEWVEPAVEQYIRTQLKMPTEDITNIDALRLTKIQLAGNKLSSCEDLKHFTNVTQLYLSSNKISDITPLAGLTNLTELSLSMNDIVDITPLAGLTKLKDLNIFGNDVVDITALAGLTDLVELSISENRVRDITPLAELTNLTKVYVTLNYITDWAPLDHVGHVIGRGSALQR